MIGDVVVEAVAIVVVAAVVGGVVVVVAVVMCDVGLPCYRYRCSRRHCKARQQVWLKLGSLGNWCLLFG